MRLKFAHFADFVTLDHRQKLVIVGIFDRFITLVQTGPIPLPTCQVVAALEATVLEGTNHHVEVRITDPDGRDLLSPRLTLPVHFGSSGPGRMLQGLVVLNLVGGFQAWKTATVPPDSSETREATT